MYDIFMENNVTLNLNVNTLEEYKWASVWSLPVEVRNKWIEEILYHPVLEHFKENAGPEHVDSNIIGTLHRIRANTTQYSMNPLIESSKRFDVVRNQHIKDYIPELWNIMDQTYYNELEVKSLL